MTSSSDCQLCGAVVTVQSASMCESMPMYTRQYYWQWCIWSLHGDCASMMLDFMH